MTPPRTLQPPTFKRPDGSPAGWATSKSFVDYPPAVAAMERRARAILDGDAGELVWLLEHPPLYTAGVSAKPADLLDPARLPVFQTRRGGQYTYHGPGQRVVYVMLDLRVRGRDTHAFVTGLERWLIDAIATFGLTGVIRPKRVGVWIERAGGIGADRNGKGEAKIAAIGVKLQRWVSFHGISLNVAPDLDHFAGIVPCGIVEHGVTSLHAEGFRGEMPDVDEALRMAFKTVFGPVVDEAAPAP
jgi:lipoyl(octanoyl) transferase